MECISLIGVEELCVHAFSQQTAMPTLFDYGIDVTSLSCQAEVEPVPLSRRDPPNATDDTGPTCGARVGRVLLLAKTIRNPCGSAIGMPMGSKIGN